MRYLLTCLSSSLPSKVFNSLEEAEGYLYTRICTFCADAVDKGFEILHYEEDGEQKTEVMSCSGPLDTSCGAEWLMQPEDKWDDEDRKEVSELDESSNN